MLYMDNRIASISVGAQGYPFLLEKIFDPPKKLYYKGALPNPKMPLLGVVGSRKMTPYGKSVAEFLIPPLVRAGIGIVSGLAYGIDTEAIRIAVDEGGFAYGVIGSGMDDASFYPKQNISLAKRMLLNGGCLFSEYPENTPALPHHFAIRNRIIAGMCHGVLVIEAAEKSGSLITAEVAMNENREVFTVPNDIFSVGSKSTNTLLQNGAHVVLSPNDILQVYDITPQARVSCNSSQNDNDIVKYLSAKPMHIDDISKASHLTAQKASAILSELEILGVVKNVGGNNFIRIHE